MTNNINATIKDVLSEKYLSYAVSTIISRSIPDVRDGLKPVHRRIIFSMYQLKLFHNSPFKKSAKKTAIPDHCPTIRYTLAAPGLPDPRLVGSNPTLPATK